MIWRQIPGTSYAASECGQIKNLNTEKVIQPVLRGCGYYVVTLHGIQTYVHRSVLHAFSGRLGQQCNHKDLNPSNNSLENLEWVTPRQNIQHYYRKILELGGQLRLTL